MKLGDLFTKLWFCTGLTDGIRPLCTPNDPHAEGIVCGYRYQASFIPEDFEGVSELELVRPETIEELAQEVNSLADQIVATMLKREPLEIRRERLKEAARTE